MDSLNCLLWAGSRGHSKGETTQWCNTTLWNSKGNSSPEVVKGGLTTSIYEHTGDPISFLGSPFYVTPSQENS